MILGEGWIYWQACHSLQGRAVPFSKERLHEQLQMMRDGYACMPWTIQGKALDAWRFPQGDEIGRSLVRHERVSNERKSVYAKRMLAYDAEMMRRIESMNAFIRQCQRGGMSGDDSDEGAA